MKADNVNTTHIVSQQSHSPKIRLFCFPYAGGGASVFHGWANDLPENLGVCAVQPPGRETRISESPIANMHELIAQFMPVIAPLLDKPFVFYGHSTGGLVAFELIRELRRQQLPLPKHLIVSAVRAPHIPEPSPLHHLPDDEFIRELERFSGTPDAILQSKELMDIYLPILRADFALEETHTFNEEVPIEVPISAFYGTTDNEAPKEIMALWAEHTVASFNLVEMTGGHFFIKTQKELLLMEISRILNKILERDA